MFPHLEMVAMKMFQLREAYGVVILDISCSEFIDKVT